MQIKQIYHLTLALLTLVLVGKYFTKVPELLPANAYTRKIHLLVNLLLTAGFIGDKLYRMW